MSKKYIRVVIEGWIPVNPEGYPEGTESFAEFEKERFDEGTISVFDLVEFCEDDSFSVTMTDLEVPPL